MNSSFQPLSLILTLAAGATLAGCVSNADQEKKLGPPPVTMVPLPPPAALPPQTAPIISVDPAPTALPTATRPPATAGDALYRVLPGDTGFKISRKHHLPLHDLQALNPDVQWNRLRVGQLVRVRADH